MTISAAVLTSRSTYSTTGYSRSRSMYMGYLTIEVHARSTSASIEHLQRDPVTVLSVPCQLDDGLYTFDDLPLDHSAKCYPGIEVYRCRTQALVLETILDKT